MPEYGRREFLGRTSVSLATVVGGCTRASWGGGPELSTEGTVREQWRVDHAEPVRSIALTSDRIYVGTKAPGPSDSVSVFDIGSGPDYMGAVSSITFDGEKRWQTEFSTRFDGYLTPRPDGIYHLTGPNTMSGPRDKQFRKLSLSGAKQWTTPERDTRISLLKLTDRRAYLGIGSEIRTGEQSRLVVLDLDGDRERRVRSAFPFTHCRYVDGSLVTAYDSRLRAYDIATEDRAWRVTDFHVAGRVFVGESVYAASRSALAAVDIATGRRRWTTELEHSFSRSYAVTDSLLVVLNREHGGSMVAVNLEDGSTRWEAPLRGHRAVAIDDAVAVTDGREVSGIDAANGSKRWELVPEGDVVRIRGGDDTLVVSSQTEGETFLTALDPDDGGRLWRVVASRDVSEVSFRDRAIYVGDRTGSVWKLVEDP